MAECKLLDGLPVEAKVGIRKRAQPRWIAPMLATLTDQRFSREGWLFEPKYEPQDGLLPDQQRARGKIDVVLQGAKLRGGFTLIQTGPGQKERWLLIKHRDEHADPTWDVDSPRFERSVLTGRSLKEIEEGSTSKKP